MLPCSLCSLEEECTSAEHTWSCRSHSQYQSPERQIWWCSELLQLGPFVVLMIHNIFWCLVFIWRWPLIEQFVVSVAKVSYSYNVWYCQSRSWDIILMDILGVINYSEDFSIWQFMINARIMFSGVLNRTKTKKSQPKGMTDKPFLHSLHTRDIHWLQGVSHGWRMQNWAYSLSQVFIFFV